MDDDNPDPTDATDLAAIAAFIERWQQADGSERANYQLFLTELCALLGLPQPDPAREDTRDNAYCFERRVVFQHGDGTQSQGFIDLYRRACYVLEAKQSGRDLESAGWDKAMLRAQGQAVQYARALPPEEGRPPFVAVVDVGRSIELYSEFSRTGGAYIPYPDPRSHRIRLADLRRPEIRARLRALWLDPLALDPSRRSARVTRDIAARLARLAVSLEGVGHPPEVTAGFLIRCLFTLFAEDIGLLPAAGFTELLRTVQDNPAQFVPLAEHLWREMNTGTPFSVILRAPLPRFNGRLFAEAGALPLDRDQIELLIEAGGANWRHVEPAIFGTLLERALDPRERHRLGAHYTPRAYVERLVLPTVIEPLREEWTAVQGAAYSLHEQGKDGEAVRLVSAFQVRLAQVRVLDPACGSGNFLYVTLEHLKRLEGEVLDTLEQLGQGQVLMEMEGVSVDPHQLLGLEINPRTATIAEMVLWIGYLQWHFRTRGDPRPPEPIIRDFRNIQCRDAVLAYDRVEWVTDEQGRPVARWDGRTFKPHPVTGEPVPDDSAQVPLERHVNPRPAQWPEADFVVGNPPFIGGWLIRQAHGDGYVEALWSVYPEVPQKADYVMYWWHKAARALAAGRLQRFGFITTNSVSQVFQRRVIDQALRDPANPISICFVIPDHPWVDAADGADVRIAMTVAGGGRKPGVLHRIVSERKTGAEERDLVLAPQEGMVNANLWIGADISAAQALRANAGICSPGVQLYGSGFIVDESNATVMQAAATSDAAKAVIKPYLNGRDFMGSSRNVWVIDFFGLDRDEARTLHPEAFQRLLDYVKPERDLNRRASIREKWWRFGWERPVWREAVTGLARFIATPEVARHRVFRFVDREVLPDNKLINMALSDAYWLGVLSSWVHVTWALASGGRLGVGNDPVYVKTRCFETFPFPAPDGPEKERIRELGEALDAHRKERQALHPGLTLTGLYNVLDKLRRAEPLGAKDKVIHAQGLVSVLRQIHDELDAAVLAAYGWQDLTAALLGSAPGSEAAAALEETLLSRLVALNAERAAEERRGLVRWLRPELQNPGGAAPSVATTEPAAPGTEGIQPASTTAARAPWPRTLPEQFQALRSALVAHPGPASAEDLARGFSRAPRARVAELLATLEGLGQARRLPDGRYLPG